MEYTIDDLLGFIERHDEHEGYYRDQLTRKIKGEALEQAADDWYDEANPITEGHWDCSPLVNEAPVLCRTPDEARSWLRARAAAIRGADHG